MNKVFAVAALALVASSAAAMAPAASPARAHLSRQLVDAGDAPGLRGWRMRVEAGSPQRLYGPAIAAEPTADFARSFVREHALLFGGAELSPRAPVHAGRFDILLLDQLWHGVPVDGGRVEMRFVHGGLALVRLELGHGLDGVAVQPALSAARASMIAAALGRGPVDRVEELRLARDGDGWRLAFPVDVGRRFTVFVDALDGHVLEIRDAFVFDTDTPVAISGLYEPRRVGDALVSAPYPFSAVSAGAQSLFAGTDGSVTISVPPAGIAATLSLDGQFVDESIFATTAQSLGVVALSPGVPDSFAWDDTTATIAERDLYQHRLKVHARHHAMAPDLGWVDTPLGYTLEIADPSGCNAFWDGLSGRVNLFRESDQCNDTARVADVVFHETTHGLHQHLSAGSFIAPDVGEGSADYVAATINGDPDIGPSFFKNTPNGIRNLEPDKVWPDDATGEPHLDGLIWGGAFWDLRTRMIAELGSAEGIAFTDTLLADTLRLDPTLDDGFQDALFADDDDGDLANGTPHQCDLVLAFGEHGLGPGSRLTIFHEPLGAAPADSNIVVRARIGSSFPSCGSSAVVESQLYWRLEGTAEWSALSFAPDTVPGWLRATIPGQRDGVTVEYRISALDGEGRSSTAPVSHAESQPFSFPVGEAQRIFFDDFETDLGWTHRLLSPQSFVGADDWQHGVPAGRAGDPVSAFSGTNVWGNDLGQNGTDGAYAPGVRNRLRSPEIDASHASGVHLRFRRWLNVQAEPSDAANVYVNGHLAWTNPLGEDVRDHEWKLEDIDLSPWADGRKIHVEFEMRSDNIVSRGGWNIDDVELVASGTREPVASCDVSSSSDPRALLLLLLAILPLIARRTCRARS